MVASVTPYMKNPDEELEAVLKLIRERALGGVWVHVHLKNREEVMRKIKDAADYPILIISAAETGLDEFVFGSHNAIGITGSEELSYIAGKVVGVTARKLGYNVINQPVLEIQRGTSVCGKCMRSFGSDKEKVAALAVAMVEGMHDGGILAFSKHYPSSNNTYNIDSHMAEAYSEDTMEDLLNSNLYPYFELMKRDLLDGIMTQHFKLVNIDPDYPASLSKKVIDVIRNQGFDGVAITDALSMMGIVAKFGKKDPMGIAIQAGNDLTLPWEDNKGAYEAVCECYEKGMIPDDVLNNAVRRVLEAQHKAMQLPKDTELTAEDIKKFEKITTDSIYEYRDEGVSAAISRDGKHLFAIQVFTDCEINDQGKVSVDTFNNGFYYPDRIMEKLDSLFPNSKTRAISQFPSAAQVQTLLEESVNYEDVIFITFVDAVAYIGKECFTSRIISIIEAMQVTNKISALVHFGNPYPLEELAHIPRIVVGTVSSEKNVYNALEVLAGNYPAKGVPTYDISLK